VEFDVMHSDTISLSVSFYFNVSSLIMNYVFRLLHSMLAILNEV